MHAIDHLRQRIATRSSTQSSCIRVVCCALLFGMHAHSGAAAEWKPERNIEIIVAATPGGGYDNLARPMQRVLTEKRIVEPTVILLNKPGAGGQLGWSYLNQRPNDGHTVSIISGTILGAQIMGQSPLKYTDFTVLPMIFNEYISFAVKADSPLKNGRDLIERLRRDPTSLSISPGTSIGTLPHIALALVLKKSGAVPDLKKLKIVAFNSTGESATAVAGGHVDVLATRPSNIWSLLQAGRLRLLAVAAPQRVQRVADVPTWKELGVDAVYGNWFGMIGPKTMTPAQVAWWDETLASMTRSDEWKKELDKNLWTDFFMNSHETRKYLDAQNEELVALLTELGMAKR